MTTSASFGTSDVHQKWLQCPIHGKYEACFIKVYNGWQWVEVLKPCPMCNEIGEQERQLSNWEKKRDAWLQEKQQTEVELWHPLIPKKFQGCTFKELENEHVIATSAIDVAKSYVANWEVNFQDGRGLLLFGDAELGKTQVAVAILQELFKEYVVLGGYCTASGLIQRIRETWSQNAVVKEWEVVKRLLKLQILVIDDLGSQSNIQGRGRGKEIIETVLCERWLANKPTIVCTACRGSKLMKMFDVSTQKAFECMDVIGVRVIPNNNEFASSRCS